MVPVRYSCKTMPESSQKVNKPRQQFVRVAPLSTRIKDAGFAIRHSRGRILFYTAGSTKELEGVDSLKIIKKDPKSSKRGLPKVQNPKMALPIIPRPS